MMNTVYSSFPSYTACHLFPSNSRSYSAFASTRLSGIDVRAGDPVPKLSLPPPSTFLHTRLSSSYSMAPTHPDALAPAPIDPSAASTSTATARTLGGITAPRPPAGGAGGGGGGGVDLVMLGQKIVLAGASNMVRLLALSRPKKACTALKGGCVGLTLRRVRFGCC